MSREVNNEYAFSFEPINWVNRLNMYNWQYKEWSNFIYTLSHTLKSPVLLSISKTIEKNKQVYYDNLKIAQASLDITGWINYFTKVIFEAQKKTRELIEFTVRKAKFFDRNRDLLNDRQMKAINRMLEQGIEGFIGGLTAKKYMSITRTSKATATRDLQRLQELGIVEQLGHERSVRYERLLS